MQRLCYSEAATHLLGRLLYEIGRQDLFALVGTVAAVVIVPVAVSDVAAQRAGGWRLTA
jgi:hypothetical protein